MRRAYASTLRRTATTRPPTAPRCTARAFADRRWWRAGGRRRPWRPSLLEEAAGGVVGEDLAAGLARRAVVDGVARVLDLPDRVAAHRAGLAGPIVHPAGAVRGRAHVGRGPLVRQALVDGLADRGATRWRPSTPSLRGRGERRELGPVAHLVGQPAADPGDRSAGRGGSRGAASSARRTARPARRRRRGRPRARGCRAAAASSASPVGTHHTPARRSVPASVSSSAAAVLERASGPGRPRGLADCFASTSSRPPCIRWTTKVTASNVERAGTCPAGRPERAGAVGLVAAPAPRSSGR